MSQRSEVQRLLLVGVLPRLFVVAVVISALWFVFFWATATPGAL